VSRPPGRRIISRPDGRTDGRTRGPARIAAAGRAAFCPCQLKTNGGRHRQQTMPARPGPAWPPPDRKQDGEGAPEVDKDDDISTD